MAPAARPMPQTCIPRRCCANPSRISTSSPSDPTTAPSPKARPITAYRRSSTWSPGSRSEELVRAVLHHLEPHGVEDGEGASEAKAEDPAEIPHVAIPSPSIALVIRVDLLARHAA